jgi:glycine/D-amino acid oxidase-like deaminating enzyme
MSSSPIRIAIIGGGIAGATSYLALSRLEGVEVTVYEGAKELR